MNERLSESYSGSENLEVMQDAVNYNGYLRDLVRRYAVSAKTALDFGAGIGTFTTAVELPPQDVICVEPDAAARALLASRGYRVAEAIESLAEDPVDYVFSLNVLEHIEDDEAALKTLHDRLRPGGVLFLYVPAFNHIRTSMDDLVGHYRRYTRAELIRLTESAGFRVNEAAYTDFLGYFATLVFSLMDRFRTEPDGRLSRPLLVAYDRVVFPVSRLLSVVFARLLGKNVYVVASRPD